MSVLDTIEEAIVGRFFRLSGSVVNEYLVVEDATTLGPDASDDDAANIDESMVRGAVTPREPSRRVLARAFNAATYTFTESDEERAPVSPGAAVAAYVTDIVRTNPETESQTIWGNINAIQARLVRYV